MTATHGQKPSYKSCYLIQIPILADGIALQREEGMAGVLPARSISASHGPQLQLHTMTPLLL